MEEIYIENIMKNINDQYPTIVKSMIKKERKKNDIEKTEGSYTCSICNGQYKKNTKGLHDITKKHTRKYNELYEKIINKLK